ncbi:SET domain-containing protein [Halalkalibacter alkaliphilus]|uniref:SET domain-containing protein n=1 Tax=Halalkalibacter alkaliphilus TaxID=2917993 RepID=A0A9X2CSN8_9BACI|nr:SET domain-containing protein [Halalkalibacter alkaliphilus]MCL7747513.1 SET domain-containing protein [Halalkalibacter alkaliphilus]
MIHPDTELRYVNDEIGFGVFATKFIPKGTIVWALDELDQVLDPSFVESLDNERKNQVKKYSYIDNKGRYVLSWDIGQYVNHSFKANCISTPYDSEIAIRDIQPGTQLTDEYGCLNLEEPFACIPEEGIERTYVRKEDLLEYYKEWDQLLLDAYQSFDKVEQPLGFLIPTAYRKKMTLSGKKRQVIDSIKTLYFEDRQ